MSFCFYFFLFFLFAWALVLAVCDSVKKGESQPYGDGAWDRTWARDRGHAVAVVVATI